MCEKEPKKRKTNLCWLLRTILAALLCPAASNLASAQSTDPVELTGTPGSEFGISVSASDPYYLIGADGANAAYVYKRDGTTWMPKGELKAGGGRFGLRVSISGDYALIGAPYANARSGSAYIFKRYGESWAQQAELTAFDAVSWAYFGHSVCISGDYALIGAPEDNVDGVTNAGSAYVFVRQSESWVPHPDPGLRKLTAPDRDAYDRFGASVAINGNYAAVGAVYNDVDGQADAGAAYVFNLLNGQIAGSPVSLTAPIPTAEEHFGNSVSIWEDCLVVGASGGDSRSIPGAAYLYNLSDESEYPSQVLTAEDGEAGDFFGAVLQIEGACIVVSAHGDDVWTGSAYLFKRYAGSWIQQQPKLIAPHRSPHDQFGICAISGKYVIVGSVGSDSAYIFAQVPVLIEPTIDIDPDTLDLSSKDKWVTCYIELPEGYDVIDIDGSTVMLDGIQAHIGEEGWARAGANSSNIMDQDGDGIPERMVKFYRLEVRSIVEIPEAVLTVTGQLIDGPFFEGIDIIRVVDEKKKD
jgi:hypothetical protein